MNAEDARLLSLIKTLNKAVEELEPKPAPAPPKAEPSKPEKPKKPPGPSLFQKLKMLKNQTFAPPNLRVGAKTWVSKGEEIVKLERQAREASRRQLQDIQDVQYFKQSLAKMNFDGALSNEELIAQMLAFIAEKNKTAPPAEPAKKEDGTPKTEHELKLEELEKQMKELEEKKKQHEVDGPTLDALESLRKKVEKQMAADERDKLEAELQAELAGEHADNGGDDDDDLYAGDLGGFADDELAGHRKDADELKRRRAMMGSGMGHANVDPSFLDKLGDSDINRNIPNLEIDPKDDPSSPFYNPNAAAALDDDPIAAALANADVQSEPYLQPSIPGSKPPSVAGSRAPSIRAGSVAGSRAPTIAGSRIATPSLPPLDIEPEEFLSLNRDGAHLHLSRLSPEAREAFILKCLPFASPESAQYLVEKYLTPEQYDALKHFWGEDPGPAPDVIDTPAINIVEPTPPIEKTGTLSPIPQSPPFIEPSPPPEPAPAPASPKVAPMSPELASLSAKLESILDTATGSMSEKLDAALEAIKASTAATPRAGTPVADITPKASKAPTPVPSKPSSPVATRQPTPAPSKQPTPVPSKQPTPVPSKQPTPVASKQATPVVSKQATPVPSKQATPVQSKQATPVQSKQATPILSKQPTPSSSPKKPPPISTPKITSPIAKAWPDAVSNHSKAKSPPPDQDIPWPSSSPVVSHKSLGGWSAKSASGNKPSSPAAQMPTPPAVFSPKAASIASKKSVKPASPVKSAAPSIKSPVLVASPVASHKSGGSIRSEIPGWDVTPQVRSPLAMSPGKLEPMSQEDYVMRRDAGYQQFHQNWIMDNFIFHKRGEPPLPYKDGESKGNVSVIYHEQSADQATDALIEQAVRRGANAVINVDQIPRSDGRIEAIGEAIIFKEQEAISAQRYVEDRAAWMSAFDDEFLERVAAWEALQKK